MANESLMTMVVTSYLLIFIMVLFGYYAMQLTRMCDDHRALRVTLVNAGTEPVPISDSGSSSDDDEEEVQPVPTSNIDGSDSDGAGDDTDDKKTN